MKDRRRWRPVLAVGVAVVAAGAGLSVPAIAGVSAQEFEECYSISNLAVSPVKTSARRGNFVTLTWDEPECGAVWDEYRVIRTDDYRPQRFMQLVTGEEGAVASKLREGRTYTFRVQVGSADEFDQEPLEVSVRMPGDSTDDWVVSLGDSFISGEGGRWAGNADLLSGLRSGADTGERAYHDDARGELIAGCHRSRAAMIHITVARSMNFACSGAITSSTYNERPDVNTRGSDPEKWKPGVDRKVFPNVALPFDGQEAIGQAEMLKRFAEDHTVKMVVLSIGGNNFYFSDIVTTCVKGYLGFSSCSEDERLAIYLSEEWQYKVRAEVKAAVQEIVWAMRDAGYDESQWTLVQTLYPKPIATADVMRYVEDPLFAYRQQLGGCGFRDADADWAINTVLPTINETVREAALEAKTYFGGQLRLVQVDNSNAFQGHELCHEKVRRVDSANSEDRGGVKSWRSKGAPDKSEWVKDIDISNLSATEKNEGFHPSYWGQLALRNCLRQVWNGGAVVSGGSCVPVGGSNKYGEPNMAFTRVAELTHVNPE